MKDANFVAINYIECHESYIERFEYLFGTRAGAIDRMPGFVRMEVLRPIDKENNTYLIVSHWENQDSFKTWTKSPEFLEGHKRGFEDIKKAREEGKAAPVRSDFKTYSVLTR